MKKVKIGFLSCILLISMVVINIQASCEYYEVQANTTCDETVQLKITNKRYPQTIVRDVISNYLTDTSIEKDKKVLVLGYDGFREDALDNVVDKEGAIASILKEGSLYYTYAGADGNQETSTAPGWLSILSGDWAYHMGVQDNEGTKPLAIQTFLDDAVKLGYSSTFIASWAPHFDVTYREDIEQPKGKAKYQQMGTDEETLNTLHQQLSDTSSFDVMFATLEYSDHAGHTYGYGNHIPAYVDASIQMDQDSKVLLDTISNRSTYQNEDWLIIITTDHGGINMSHGGQSEEEVYTWFVVNKDISNYL